ncbi:MAG: 50S ribosomal protein L10 [Chloroflexaceae bacterium]|nr:50S ribosomal protein L10 [Chloroflexaceae bacterium]
MPSERKIGIVSDLTDKMSRMQLAMVADYRGMTVAEMAELRQKLRESQSEVYIAKNTLIRLVARETGHDAMESLLEGPTALILAYDDMARFAKEFKAYLQASKKLTIRGGILGNSLLGEDGLDQVEKMPSRQQVLAQIVGGVQSPLAGLVGMLSAPPRDIVSLLNTVVADVSGVLQARIDQLQSQSAAEAA